MRWHEFVFSEKAQHRVTRHFAFWLAWWLYFFGSRYFLPQPVIVNGIRQSNYITWDLADFVQSLLIIAIQMLACYAFIYFLLPVYLLKARYYLFMAGMIVLGIVLIQATHIIMTEAMPFINLATGQPSAPYQTTYWESVSFGGINAIKIVAAAAAIKLVKHWHRKQKEKERLEKEKIEAELQLLKTQIHPGFLFNTLNNIYAFALSASPKAPDMLLKLSDILSYMLYECNEPDVALEKEINMLHQYMALEKIRFGDKLEMNVQVKGDTGQDKIAPLLLLGFVEHSFQQCSRMTEQPWLNLQLQIENHGLVMKLLNGKPVAEQSGEEAESNLAQACKRIELLYPGQHHLKITEEEDIMMVNLEVQLNRQTTPSSMEPILAFG